MKYLTLEEMLQLHFAVIEDFGGKKKDLSLQRTNNF
jgi:hypothetical protein